MREIKFRGKSIITSEWVYGYYWTNENGNHFIRQTVDLNGCFTISDTEVDENTIGQYTGLKDKNGVEIYEGDVINCNNRNFIVEFRKERGGFFPFACGDGCGCCEDEVISSYAIEELTKIIGNIWDNPEQLKESDNKCQN